MGRQRGEDLARSRARRQTRPRNMKIQVYLTAAAVNLKRLAAALFEFWLLIRFQHECSRAHRT